MKKFQIKYETYVGNVHTITVTAIDQQCAESQLLNCKYIYWCKPVGAAVKPAQERECPFPADGIY